MSFLEHPWNDKVVCARIIAIIFMYHFLNSVESLYAPYMQHLEPKQLKPLLRRTHSYIGRLLVLLQVDKITDDVIKTVAHTGSVQTCQIRSQITQEH